MSEPLTAAGVSPLPWKAMKPTHKGDPWRIHDANGEPVAYNLTREDAEFIVATSTAARAVDEALSVERDPLVEWLEVCAFTKPGQKVTVTRGGTSWYANIVHEQGYTLWYMPGVSPRAALRALADTLAANGSPRRDITGEWGPAESRDDPFAALVAHLRGPRP